MEKTVPSEKRKSPRFSADFPVKYSTTDSFFKSARAANASEGGGTCLPSGEDAYWSAAGAEIIFPFPFRTKYR